MINLRKERDLRKGGEPPSTPILSPAIAPPRIIIISNNVYIFYVICKYIFIYNKNYFLKK